MQNEKHILLFDGVCNLCNASVQFILRRDKNKKFLFASLQSDIALKLLPSASNYTTDLQSIVLLKDGKILDKSTAALHIAKDLCGVWPLLYYLFIWWPKCIRDVIYKFIAKRRYKWFGKQESCNIPDESNRDRFLE